MSHFTVHCSTRWYEKCTMDREVCHFSYLLAKQWTVKCAISRIYVLNNGPWSVCHFSHLNVPFLVSVCAISRICVADTRNGTLHGPLFNTQIREMAHFTVHCLPRKYEKYFSYLRFKQWKVKCVISRIYVCYFIAISCCLQNVDTRNGTLHGPLFNTQIREMTHLTVHCLTPRYEKWHTSRSIV
jgi:hypothetical protein